METTNQPVDVYPNMFIESYRRYEKHLLGLQPPNCCPKKKLCVRPKQSKTASKSQAFMDLLAEKLKEALKRWDEGQKWYVKNGMIHHDFIIHPVIHRYFFGYPYGISMVNDGYPAW